MADLALVVIRNMTGLHGLSQWISAGIASQIGIAGCRWTLLVVSSRSRRLLSLSNQQRAQKRRCQEFPHGDDMIQELARVSLRLIRHLLLAGRRLLFLRLLLDQPSDEGFGGDYRVFHELADLGVDVAFAVDGE